jgi:hypothetical protein
MELLSIRTEMSVGVVPHSYGLWVYIMLYAFPHFTLITDISILIDSKRTNMAVQNN